MIGVFVLLYHQRFTPNTAAGSAEASAAVPGDRLISLQRFEQGKIGFAGGRD
jgi:hypothetical protein